jgi:hypothetical protein
MCLGNRRKKVQEKYLRGVQEWTGYIVREECKRNRLRVKVGKRATNFENIHGKEENGMFERNEKNMEKKERERNTIRETSMSVKK